MPQERFPADQVPKKPVPEIGDQRAHEIYSKSYGSLVLNTEPIWEPSKLDVEYFNRPAPIRYGED